jgi:hypothetical protein
MARYLKYHCLSHNWLETFGLIWRNHIGFSSGEWLERSMLRGRGHQANRMEVRFAGVRVRWCWAGGVYAEYSSTSMEMGRPSRADFVSFSLENSSKAD